MSDEVEQLVETPDSNAAETDAAEDVNNQAAANILDDDSSEHSQEQAEEDEEVEIGDQKVALPRSLAEKLRTGFMQHADYTQKTQSVAEERKQIAVEREQVQQQAIAEQAFLDDLAEVRSINNQLKKIDEMNLAQYVESDPLGVMKVQEQRRALESQKMALEQGITQKRNDKALGEQQEIAKRAQDADAYLEREIPNWGKGRGAVIQDYGVAQGIPREQLIRGLINNPKLGVFLDKAEKFDALMKKQAPKTTPVTPAKPALKVGSNATVQKDPSKMSDREFAEWRQKQIRNRK